MCLTEECGGVVIADPEVVSEADRNYLPVAWRGPIGTALLVPLTAEEDPPVYWAEEEDPPVYWGIRELESDSFSKWVYRCLATGKTYSISAVVKSEEGQQLAGVKIDFDAAGDGSNLFMSYQTGPSGAFGYAMRVGPQGRRPFAKALWFSKAGYVTKKVDFCPEEPIREVRLNKCGA
jgi:hypothetical protein